MKEKFYIRGKLLYCESCEGSIFKRQVITPAVSLYECDNCGLELTYVHCVHSKHFPKERGEDDGTCSG